MYQYLRNALLTIGMMISCTGLAQGQTATYDGNWWLSMPAGARETFLEGYLDCLVDDVGDHRYDDCPPTAVMAKKMTSYYNQSKDNLSKDVMVVFDLMSQGEKFVPLKGGEEYPEKHGYMDGGAWFQSEYAERVGIISGYLKCQKKYNKPEITFSHAIEWYVAQITSWYGISGSKVANPDKLDEYKIADVLFAIEQAGGIAGANPVKRN